jgi:hypothetical protein
MEAMDINKKGAVFTAPFQSKVKRTLSTSASTLTFACLIDVKSTASEILGVKTLYSGSGTIIVHLDETESSRATGLTVGDEGYFVNGSVRLESGTDVLLRRVEWKIADV